MNTHRNYDPRIRRKNNAILKHIDPKCNCCGSDNCIVISSNEESVLFKCRCGNIFEIEILLED